MADDTTCKRCGAVMRMIGWFLRRRGLCVADVDHLNALERELHRHRRRLGIATFGTERVARA